MGASPNTEWSIVKMFWPTSMSLSPRVYSTLIYTSTWASPSPGATNQSQTAAKMLKSQGPPIWTSEVQQACSQQVLKPSVFSGSLKEKSHTPQLGIWVAIKPKKRYTTMIVVGSPMTNHDSRLPHWIPLASTSKSPSIWLDDPGTTLKTCHYTDIVILKLLARP